MSFCYQFGIFYKNFWLFAQKHHDYSGKYSEQSITSMRMIWEKTMEEVFGLGKKSLGSDTDTETWSWLGPSDEKSHGLNLRIFEFFSKIQAQINTGPSRIQEYFEFFFQKFKRR